MHSPQRLFDVGRATGDLLAHDSFLDRARLERERDNDAGARRALGAYLVARLIDRLLELDGSLDGSDDEATQGFAWQLEGGRRFVAELGEDAEVSHLRGIIDAVSSDPLHRTSVVRVSLSAYAYFLEHAGRWADALDVLGLVGRTWGEAPPMAEVAGLFLGTGRLNRLLARWSTAREAYWLAEEAALVVGDEYLALRARLGRGAVMRGQGNLPLARSIAEEVIARASDQKLADVVGMGYADLGAVLTRMGQRIEALQAIYNSFLHAHDPTQRAASLGDLGLALSDLGSYDTARSAFHLVLDANPGFQVLVNARIELMQIESAVGNRVAFERHRGAAKAVVDRMPPSMAVDYRLKAGAGFARFGQVERARTLWEEGRALAETYQLNDWYFRLDRALTSLGTGTDCLPPVPLTDSELEHGAESVVAEIGAGLREVRELAHA